MKTRLAICHPDQKHKAYGLCLKCYENSGRRRSNAIKATCHPELAHQAKGLCKSCYMKSYLNVYSRPKESLDKRKEGSWKRYGIEFSVDEYDAMLLSQGGVCAVCLTNPSGRRLAVDHCHGSGRVRGLLCDYCNRRLLIARNTVEVLKRAVAYLSDVDQVPPVTP
jgi:hypothetical protein